MAVIRWNPWNVQDFFDNNWDMPTIPGLSRIMGQGLNIYEKEDEIVAEMAMPGIPEDNIDITIDDGVVRVSGTRSEKKEEKDKRKYYMTSMSNSFNYSFRLPMGAVEDREPDCQLSDGILELRFIKTKKSPPKKVKVRRGEKKEKEEPVVI